MRRHKSKIVREVEYLSISSPTTPILCAVPACPISIPAEHFPELALGRRRGGRVLLEGQGRRGSVVIPSGELAVRTILTLMPEGLTARAAKCRFDNLPDEVHVRVKLQGLEESHENAVGCGVEGGGITCGVPDDLGRAVEGSTVDRSDMEGGETMCHRVDTGWIVLVDNGEETLDGEAVTHSDGNESGHFPPVLHGGSVGKPKDGS
jgi:hypothetical protein